jgi:hypothetical protein
VTESLVDVVAKPASVEGQDEERPARKALGAEPKAKLEGAESELEQRSENSADPRWKRT